MAVSLITLRATWCRCLVTFKESRGGGYQDCCKRSKLLFSALFYQVCMSLRGKKPCTLQIHSFSCPMEMLKYLQNWENIHLVLSFNSITDAEER